MARPKEFDPDVAVGAAMDLFWRQGYGATTPAELLDALGIGKGSFYNTFDSKHALFARALRRYGDERVASLINVLGRPGRIRGRLEAALERLAATGNAHLSGRGCMAVNTVAERRHVDDATLAIVRTVFDRMERTLQTTIEGGQRERELAGKCSAEDLASLFVAVIIGMTVIARTRDRTGRAKRVVRAVMSLL
jgi:TetR/AcrR family transcriptional repressor of nem operon